MTSTPPSSLQSSVDVWSEEEGVEVISNEEEKAGEGSSGESEQRLKTKHNASGWRKVRQQASTLLKITFIV